MEGQGIPVEKKRLDVEMANRNLVRSRSLAADLIKRGKVKVNGAIAPKANMEVAPSDEIAIENGEVFVSRAGEKLAHALKSFGIDVSGLIALDIGSSTGGFTDCLLRNGAKKVVAIDVGTDQLDESLRNDPRIELYEGTDIRKFSLPSPADIATIDVSFISLSHILPKAFELVKPKGSVIALVKPLFEVGKEIADRFKGVIADEDIRRNVLEETKRNAEKAGFSIIAETTSPIEGEKGNKEFLLYLKKG